MSDLRAPKNGSAVPAGTVAIWLRNHPEAVMRLDEWLQLRATGETMWSLVDIIADLRERFEMPGFSTSSFRAWLNRNREKVYRRGLAQ